MYRLYKYIDFLCLQGLILCNFARTNVSFIVDPIAEKSQQGQLYP